MGIPWKGELGQEPQGLFINYILQPVAMCAMPGFIGLWALQAPEEEGGAQVPHTVRGDEHSQQTV